MKNTIKQLIIGLSILAAAVSCNQVELPSHGEPKEDKDVNVQLVGISRDTITVVKEFTYALHAAVYPDHAAAKDVLWTSLNEDVATVNDTGLVYGMEFGQTKVVLALKDGTLTDTCVVNVLPNVHVESVAVNPAETDLILGEKITLEPVVLPEDSRVKDVTWSTSDPEIATVDEKGRVEGLKEGTVTITATSVDGGKTGTCVVTVKRIAVTGVTLNVTEITLAPEAKMPLTATVAPADAHFPEVTWSSSDLAVAEVDETGQVTAKALGTAVITVTTVDGGFTAQCTVTVAESTARTLTLTFIMTDTNAQPSLAEVKDNITTGYYDFVTDDGNSYTWEIFRGGSGATTCNGTYFVLGKYSFMGTPEIPGAKLKTFTFTQAASTKTARRSAMTTVAKPGPTSAADYDASVEASGADRVTGTQGESYTYTIINPQEGKRYYFECTNSGIGVSKIVLTYELEPIELTFDLSTRPASLDPVKNDITTGYYDFVANDGKSYTWEIFRGGSGATTYKDNTVYFILGKYSFMGTPEIPGRILKTFTFTQAASTKSNRKSAMTTVAKPGPTSAADYDASVEASGADRVTGTQGESYTYTIINPQEGKRYYFECTNSGIGVSKITLLYE